MSHFCDTRNLFVVKILSLIGFPISLLGKEILKVADYFAPKCMKETSLVWVDKRGFFRGGDGGIRTLDLTDANRTLSQLSYAPTSARKIIAHISDL